MKNTILSKKLLCILLMIIILATSIGIVPNKVKAAKTYTQTVKSGIDAFPESYQVLLKKLMEETEHTNWNFQAYYTGIDWNEFISKESVCGRNRIYQAFDTIYRDECNNLASGYYCADEEIIKYFADPRNFLTERNIFQFLEISYNESLYTKNIIEDMVKKYKVFNYGKPITFVMSDEKHEKYEEEVTMTFTDIIMEAAKQSQMSPISIVIKIVQEVGADGSLSTSGTYEGYENCYNYFNIGAYDTGDAIANGLKYADKAGWHCPYTSIVEGAIYNSDNYILQGQNTAYFYKFDCVGSSILKDGETQTVTSDELYYHQYMTNVYDPYSQSSSLFSTYTNNDLLDKKLNFIIPVFDNMPEYTTKPSSVASSDQELYYANVTSSVNTRKGAGTNYGTVTVEYTTSSGKTASTSLVLYKDDLVIMLEREAATNNGMSWDKVQFWNGKIGYVATQYLEKYEKKSTGMGGSTEEPPIENPSTGDVYKDMIDYAYADVSTSLNIRSGAGSTYKIIGSLNSNEEFFILEKLDGWYKIATEYGLQGYVSSEYSKVIKTYEKKDDEIIVIPKANAKMLAKMMNFSDYKIFNGDTEITDDTLATNYSLKIDDKEYTIIKMGDVNGDGRVNTGDAIAVQRDSITEDKKLDGVYYTAADINRSNGVNTGDAVVIQRFIVGLKSVSL